MIIEEKQSIIVIKRGVTPQLNLLDLRDMYICHLENRM